jgi:putative transposase
MAHTEHYYTKFEEGKFYHIYNRTVDRKPMFNNEGNYKFFLRKYDLYLSSVIETYALVCSTIIFIFWFVYQI